MGENYHFSPINKEVHIIDKFNFRKYDDDLITELKKLKKSKLRKSVIHGDFHSSNLLTKKDRIVAIIDWDDAHEDFVVFDAAVLIAHSFITKKECKRDKIRLFLKEYQKYIKLNKEEKKALYYFIKQRYLGVIDWCVKQRRKHKDKHTNITKWLDDITKRYYNFNKVSLEEFMDYFKEPL